MKIYTRTGDNGTTSLVGGHRTAKDSPRLEAYGTVDELNSHIGLLLTLLPADTPPHITHTLLATQSRLFDLGAYLATDNTTDPSLTPAGITPDTIHHLETQIDLLTSTLPPLHSFILPGGTPAAAQAHITRTVARRAERRLVTLSDTATLHPLATAYLNRLSDYLFTLSRTLNHLSHTPETPWHPTK